MNGFFTHEEARHMTTAEFLHYLSAGLIREVPASLVLEMMAGTDRILDHKFQKLERACDRAETRVRELESAVADLEGELESAVADLEGELERNRQ